MVSARSSIQRAQRIVIKIGSRALSTDRELIARIAADIARLAGDRRRFVVVSSGAIALGFERLGFRKRPKEMAELQACAAVGQSILMQRWAASFEAHGVVAAQVLLTHADLTDRERLNNARQALSGLIDAGAVPVINENDTVATEEIRFGDNDQLAAMVAPVVGADLLLLLTDVNGVLDASGEVMKTFKGEALAAASSVEGSVPRLGSGGIGSKIDAAHKGTRSGAAVVIANATRPGVIEKVLSGAEVGTYFAPHVSALKARKHWIAFTLRPRGAILLDAGAARALKSGKNSLLPVGVLGVRGQFNSGDSVLLLGPDAQEVGRGLCRLSSADVAVAAGRSSDELRNLLPQLGPKPIVVHKEDLVLTES
ncbi:MAG TPA: glutamate 5-kinase [Polyangiaceae bacterium]|nr:glutamate 5-kinase [Polyangiaceae bacterium]